MDNAMTDIRGIHDTSINAGLLDAIATAGVKYSGWDSTRCDLIVRSMVLKIYSIFKPNTFWIWWTDYNQDHNTVQQSQTRCQRHACSI